MMIDSHCHLHDPTFADLAETLRTAMTHDVWGVVAVGCDAETNARTMKAAAAAPKAVWACLGFHPDWTRLTDDDLDRVEAQISAHHSRIVGVGEIGLRRSLGAARRHIAGQFLLESTALGLVGGVMGAAIGTLVVVAVAATRTWTPVLEPWVPLGAPLIGGFVGLLAGAYPSARAASLEPVEALRSAMG